jgi:pyruvate dehydrogenase E2 component (dihydrolipoamide acetyltransferase)
MKHITVPDIGDFKNVPVLELLVAVGDSVAKDQTIAVLESDKATLDIPSSEAGIVAALEVKIGDRVSSGSVVLTVQSPQDESPLQAAASTPLVPPVPEALTSSAVARTVAPLPAPLTQASRVHTSNVVPIADSAVGSAEESLRHRVRAGPSTRRFARELGVDLQQVKGTGRGGRITSEDVRGYVKSFIPKVQGLNERQAADAAQMAPFTLVPWPRVDFEKFGPVETRPLSRICKISGANLHRNLLTIPHVTNHDDADVTDLEAFRSELNREQEKNGVKISPLAFVMKACVAALQAFPDFNASLDGDTLILKRYFHIGFAADTPIGLVVPVIQNADQKRVGQIAREMVELAAKARAGKLSSADMQGGCFSISSLGSIGGSYFTPIINAPEVAILGIGKTQIRVAWIDGKPQPRLYLPLSLSWDHRVVDGAAAGRFNAHLARALGDLRRLLL